MIIVDTKQAAHELLQQAGIDVEVEFEFTSIPTLAGGFDPAANCIFLPAGRATAEAVLHEGAHACHWRLLGLLGQAVHSLDVAERVGTVLASELYVGVRLADIPGFEAQERLRNSNYGSYGHLVQMQKHVGTHLPAGLYHLPGIRPVMLSLPLLGVETVRGALDFFSNIAPMTGYPGFLMRVAEVLSKIDVQRRANLKAFGDILLDHAAKLGFEIQGLD